MDVGKKGGRKREGDRKENGKVEERDDGGKREKKLDFGMSTFNLKM